MAMGKPAARMRKGTARNVLAVVCAILILGTLLTGCTGGEIFNPENMTEEDFARLERECYEILRKENVPATNQYSSALVAKKIVDVENLKFVIGVSGYQSHGDWYIFFPFTVDLLSDETNKRVNVGTAQNALVLKNPEYQNGRLEAEEYKMENPRFLMFGSTGETIEKSLKNLYFRDDYCIYYYNEVENKFNVKKHFE